jgi:hypothetical protein
MKMTCTRKAVFAFCLLLASFAGTRQSTAADRPRFSLDDVKSYPFPMGLTSAASGDRIAWASNQAGRRNVYVAEGPDFRPSRLTRYEDDDGQEIKG